MRQKNQPSPHKAEMAESVFLGTECRSCLRAGSWRWATEKEVIHHIRHVDYVDRAVTVDIPFLRAGGRKTATEQIINKICQVGDINVVTRITIDIATDRSPATAGIADITNPVAGGIFLTRVIGVGTVVIRAGVGGEAGIAVAVTVSIRAGITDITDFIKVSVLLKWVGKGRTIVAQIADPVAVAVLLVGVKIVRAVIAGISDIIAISVFLAGVVVIKTIIAQVAHTVAVCVRLFGV